MLCNKKTHLLDAYVAAVDHHAEMVSILSKTTEGHVGAFKTALANAEEARHDAETARLALNDHTKTHGC